MRKISVVSTIVLFILILAFPTFAASEPPAEGGPLPVIKLPIPKSPEEKKLPGTHRRRLFYYSQG